LGNGDLHQFDYIVVIIVITKSNNNNIISVSRILLFSYLQNCNVQMYNGKHTIVTIHNIIVILYTNDGIIGVLVYTIYYVLNYYILYSWSMFEHDKTTIVVVR